MGQTRFHARIVFGLLTATALATPAVAQEASVVPFPIRQFQDENGVDLLSGLFTALSPGVSIGGEDTGLTYVREVRGNAFRDTMMWNIAVSGSTYTVALGSRSERFTLSGGIYTPVENNGSTLTYNGTTTYTYTTADGTVATFRSGPTIFFGNSKGIVVETVAYPSGRTLTFHYHEDSYLTPRGQTKFGRRLQGVSTNAGWQLNFQYASDIAGPGTLWTWARMVKVKGLNSSEDSCSPLAFSCPQTGRPQLDISGSSYTDAEGRTTQFTLTGGQVTGVRLPGSTSDDISVTYTGGRVTSITRFGVTTGYASSDASGVRTVTATRPGGATRVVKFDIADSVMLSDQNELGEITSYQYDSDNRLTRITHPEGNYVQFTYDARGNVTETRHTAKSGTGLADIVTAAAYPASCGNALTCNKPTSTTDARGNTTDYSYSATHGGVLSVSAPAPTAGANRPEVRFGYTELNSSGAPSGTGIWRPTGGSTCRTGAAPACIGTADEMTTTIAYGQGLLPSSIGQEAGNGTLTATQAMTYDVAGNLVTVDGPLSGTADTLKIRYNLAGQVIGEAGPDPDGAGASKFLATRYSYNARGQLYLTESGTVNGLSDTDWANFSPTGNTLVEFDSHGRPIRQKVRNGSTIYQVVDTRYDTMGRVQCAIVRMTPASWGTVASSCTPPQAGDRVTYNHYDALGRVWKVTSGYGTSVAADDRTSTFTGNGQVATVTDAEGNKTTYEYDGHDRLVKTRFPNPSTAGVSSTTDYELVGYDKNGNVTSFRTRRAETLSLTYDNLDRLVTKVVPQRSGLSSTHTRDVYFGYDLLGNMTYARFDSTGGQGIANAFDALGQLTSSTVNLDGQSRQLSYQYDAAGNRTRITHPDGQYFKADLDVLGRLTTIRQNSTAMGGVEYDTQGRMSARSWDYAVASANSTTWGYDAAGRLSSLGIDVHNSADDVAWTFSYNPANQIASQARTNDAYAWTGAVGVDRDYTPNGLNQYSAITGLSGLAYDANGNLTSDGVNTYVYDVENRLVSRSGGGTSATLRYDPLGRLYEVNGSATGITRFLYDGSDLVAEYNSAGTLLRRYVHGLGGGDDPLIWYEGGAVNYATRRYLHSDRLGSVVAVTNYSGTAIAKNTYDEYGIPGSANEGRFQYTGQAWLPELGMYHYKARMYSPTLGRFMQTDPIGYGDGMNMYAYVRNDPVNFVDPTGLICYVPYAGFDVGDADCANEDYIFVIPQEQRNDSDSSLGGLGRGNGTSLSGGRSIGGSSANRQAAQTPQKKEEPSTLKKLGQCAADEFGLTALGGALAGAGANILGTGGKFSGATPGTSIASRAASAVFGDLPLPRALPTLTGFPGIGNGLRVSSTLSAARFAGRAVPVIGYAILAYDAYKIGKCVLKDE